MFGNEVQFRETDNCNVSYLDSLYLYRKDDMEGVITYLFTRQATYWDNEDDRDDKRPEFTQKTCGIILFMQGSEHDLYEQPYAPELAAYIRENNLGTVMESGPAPNPLHNFKPGYLFAWVINRDAVEAWWKEKVQKPWEERQAKRNRKTENKLAKAAEKIRKQMEHV